MKEDHSNEDNFIKQLLSFIFINVLIPRYISAKNLIHPTFMEFSLDPVHDIPLSGEVPIALRDCLLPITQQHIAATGKGFQFMLQEATTPGIRLIHSTYKTARAIRFNIHDTKPLSCIAIALRHDRILNIEGLGIIRLKEGQFNALYAPQGVVQSLHQRDQETITLSIQFDSRIWEEAEGYFPAVHDFLAKMNANKPALLLQSNGWVTRDIRDSLYHLLHTDKTTTGFPLYFGVATRLVLFQLLQQSQKQQPPSPYTNDEIDGMHAARGTAVPYAFPSISGPTHRCYP
jgi:hypothetical protein